MYFKRLKALAALSGQSIKKYVIQRTLPESDEASALRELETLLKPRIESARTGQLVDKFVDDPNNSAATGSTRP